MEAKSGGCCLSPGNGDTQRLQHHLAERWRRSMEDIWMLQSGCPGSPPCHGPKTSFSNWFRRNRCPEVWAARGGAGRALPAPGRACCLSHQDLPSPTSAWGTLHVDLGPSGCQQHTGTLQPRSILCRHKPPPCLGAWTRDQGRISQRPGCKYWGNQWGREKVPAGSQQHLGSCRKVPAGRWPRCEDQLETVASPRGRLTHAASFKGN